MTRSMGYIFLGYVQRARACVHSLIFERIVSELAGNILRLTIGGKDYVLFIFTHRAHAYERAYVYLWTDSLQICGEHTANHIK
jgi:hypothetical protein